MPIQRDGEIRGGRHLGRMLFDPSRVLFDPSRVLLDPSRTLLDPSDVLLEPSRVLLDPSRVLLDLSRTLLDPSRGVSKGRVGSVHQRNPTCPKNLTPPEKLPRSSARLRDSA